MIRTYILQFDPSKSEFRAKVGGANAVSLTEEATFVEVIDDIVLDMKKYYGSEKIGEIFTQYDHMTELHEAEHAAIVTTKTFVVEQDAGAALPIPEPTPLKDAVGTVVETEEIPVERKAWESGTASREAQPITEKGEGDKEAPVETQPEPIPDQDNPTPAQEPEKIPTDSPATVHDEEVAVVGAD
jgi:hypothetical protein